MNKSSVSGAGVRKQHDTGACPCVCCDSFLLFFNILCMK